MDLRIMILNGWATAPEIWDPFITALCIAEGLTRDQIHLLSWHEAMSPEDYKSLATALIERIQSEEPKAFVLMGWSLGAIVALEILPALTSKPTMLVIFSGSTSFCHVSLPKGWSKKEVETMKGYLVKDKAGTLKTFYQRVFTRRERDLGFDQVFLGPCCAESVASLASGLDYLIQTDLNQTLKGIDSPVLWIHGEEDRICPVEGATGAIAHFRDVQLITLAKTGHGPFITREKDCIEAFQHFMDLKLPLRTHG